MAAWTKSLFMFLGVLVKRRFSNREQVYKQLHLLSARVSMGLQSRNEAYGGKRAPITKACFAEFVCMVCTNTYYLLFFHTTSSISVELSFFFFLRGHVWSNVFASRLNRQWQRAPEPRGPLCSMPVILSDPKSSCSEVT